MVRVVTNVALDEPATDPNIDEEQTFTMDGTVTGSGSHAWDFNVHWEWDQGLGDSDANYVDMPTTGGTLNTTGDANPENNVTNANLAAKTITATAGSAGSYFVRISTIDNNDSSNEDVSTTQAVTINVVASGRIMGSIAGQGGLAGQGGIAGKGGGLAG